MILPEACNVVGLKLRNEGDLLNAESNFRKAIAYDLKYYPAHFNLGHSSSARGRSGKMSRRVATLIPGPAR